MHPGKGSFNEQMMSVRDQGGQEINGEICICKRGQINLNAFIKEYTRKGHEDRNAAKSTDLLRFTVLCCTVFLPGGISAFFKHSFCEI